MSFSSEGYLNNKLKTKPKKHKQSHCLIVMKPKEKWHFLYKVSAESNLSLSAAIS